MGKKRKERAEKVDRRARRWVTRDARFGYDVEVSIDGLAFEKRCLSSNDREYGQGLYEERSDRLQGPSIFEATETWSEIHGALGTIETAEMVVWIHTLFVELGDATPPARAAPPPPQVEPPRAAPAASAAAAASHMPQPVHKRVPWALPRRDGWLPVGLYLAILLTVFGALVYGGVRILGSGVTLVRSAYRAQVDHAYRPVMAAVVAQRTTSPRDARRTRRSKYGGISVCIGVRYLVNGATQETTVPVPVVDTVAGLRAFDRTYGLLHEGSPLDVLVDEAYPLEPVLNDASLPGAGSLMGGLFGILFGALLVGLLPGILLVGFLPAWAPAKAARPRGEGP